MTRYVKANRPTGEHSGKSGYIATQGARSPKPFPWGVAEEYASSFYPQYRGFIPEKYQPITDSYYDLRNQKYKYWYDKWGKPHINKWWQGQLDATLRIQKAYERQTTKNTKRRNTTFPSFNGKRSRSKRWTTACTCTQYCPCGNKYVSKSVRRRPKYRVRQWQKYS